MTPPNLLRSFEIIKNELDKLADEYILTTDNSPQFADAVTAVDKLCKILMRTDFSKKDSRHVSDGRVSIE